MIRKLFKKIFRKKNHVEITEMSRLQVEANERLKSLIIVMRSNEIKHEVAMRRRANAAYRQQMIDAEIADMTGEGL